MIKVIMGQPGAGKSTLLAWYARNAIKKGLKVYSTYEIKGCFKLDLQDLGKYDLRDCLVILDEAGKDMNCRNFKGFSDNLYNFFTLHRHYNIDIIIGVQYWDRLDKVVRELIAKIYIVQPTVLRHWFIKVRQVGVEIAIDENTHQIIEKFYWIPILGGGMRFIYRKQLMKMFNSYENEMLLDKEFDRWGDIEHRHSILKHILHWLTRNRITPEGE